MGFTPDSSSITNPVESDDSIDIQNPQIEGAPVAQLDKAWDLYRSKGWVPVPVAPGKKRPSHDDWEIGSGGDAEKALLEDAGNIGLILGGRSRLIDTDLDCDLAVRLAPRWLQPTPLRSGRATRPDSHWWYQVPVGQEVPRTHQLRHPTRTVPGSKAKKMLVELRGNGAESTPGFQTCVWPSTHPDGDQYEWSEDPSHLPEPAGVQAEEHIRRVHRLGASILVAESWEDGCRNDLSNAITGSMAKRGHTEEDARDFLGTVADALDDPCLPPKDRFTRADAERNVRDTFEKYRKGGHRAVTGTGEMTEILGDERLTKRILKWLDRGFGLDRTDSIDREIESLNEQYAVVRNGTRARIMYIRPSPSREEATIELHSEKDFKLLERPRGTVSNPKTGREIAITELWLRSSKRRFYHGITFDPSGVGRDGYFNLWQGFAVEPKPGDCGLFWDHVRDNLCRGDDELFGWVKAWLADMAQNPGRLAETAIVLRGEQGVGKSFFARVIMSLLGRHAVHLSSPKSLTGNFNAVLESKVLVFADEAFWAGDKAAEGQLKRMVTEPTLVIERKFLDPVEVPNCTHLIVSSNHDWVVPAGLRERRFAVLDIGNRQARNRSYFAAIQQQLDAGGREALFHELLHFDIAGSRQDPKVIPMTEALVDQKVHSLPPVERFWLARLRIGTMLDEHEDWEDWVLTSDLYDQYVEDARHQGVRFKDDGGQFMRQTLDIFPGARRRRKLCERLRGRSAGKQGRFNGYYFPSRDACQLILATHLGVDPDHLFATSSRSAVGQQASPAKVIPIMRAGAGVSTDDDGAAISSSDDDEENVQSDG